MGNRYSDIDVMTFVQGNTARKSDLYRTVNYCGHNSDDRLSVERNRCVVYDFRREAAAASRPYTGHGVRAGRANSLNRNTDKRSDRRTVKRGSGKKAARARARRIFAVRTASVPIWCFRCPPRLCSTARFRSPCRSSCVRLARTATNVSTLRSVSSMSTTSAMIR